MKNVLLLLFIGSTIILTSCKNTVSSTTSNEISNENRSVIGSSDTNNVTFPFSEYKSYMRDKNIEKILTDNPIDKAFMKDYSLSELDDLTIIDKYSNIWDSELVFVINELQKQLKGEQLTELNDLQNNWNEFVENDIKLAADIHLKTAGKGSEISVLNGYKSIELTRKHTLELIEYLYMFTGEYQFNYK